VKRAGPTPEEGISMYDDASREAWADRPTGTNGLGVAGFVIALIGPCTAGLLSPLGLLLSLIALRKPPRGFAVAGAILGVLGSLLLVLTVWLGSLLFPLFMKGVELGKDYDTISSAVSSYAAANNGAMPPDLASAGVPVGAQVDPWGTPYRFEVSADGASWKIVTAAMDGVFGTADDGVFESGLTQNQVGERFGKMIERHMEDRFGGGRGRARPAPAPAGPAGDGGGAQGQEGDERTEDERGGEGAEE
jgi:hypothetical protein